MKKLVMGAIILGSFGVLLALAQSPPQASTPAPGKIDESDRSGPLLFGLWAGTARPAAILAAKQATGVSELQEHDEDVVFGGAKVGEQRCDVILSFFKGRLLATAVIYSDPSTEKSVANSLETKYGPAQPIAAGMDDKVWMISTPAATMVTLTHVANRLVVQHADMGEVQREFRDAKAKENVRQAELEEAIPRETPK